MTSRTNRMTVAGASRMNNDATAPGTSAVRTKPIRVTVDLDPALYRRVKGWAESIAVDLDVPSMPLGKLFRALAEGLADDPAVAIAVTRILQHNSVTQ